ncbi:DUF3021 domain-containing protein [uncultured Lactobacillus sp.]|uniref:DUF3021 domain-containing protein n=1 Tax=uncultured Lactobacillus sp. TaxID=153152 RepID=UPI00259BD312|nr:DUF3021 domain-containing protein [uncultured Lactobacillus sp.]
MKHVRYMLNSGLIGIGIGMIWIAVDLLSSLDLKNLEIAKLSAVNFLFWLVASFLIGIFFYFAGWIFNNDSWSLRKQIVVNFFVCLIAWVLFNLIINSFSYSWSLLMTTVISFIIMYTIAYGTYFYHLWHEVNQINKKLKKNGE